MNRKDFLSVTGLAGISVFTGVTSAASNAKPGLKESESPVKINYEKIRLELWHDWTISRGTATYKENVFVYYQKDGITGVGEAAHMTAAGQDADRTIKELELLIPLYKNRLPHEFFDLPNRANKILPGISPAKAALDIALMDWIGKKHGLPLYKFFGLNPETKVKTSFSIGRDTPDAMKQKVAEAAPYHILKIKLTNDGDEDVIRTIRSVTDKPIRVDINEGWLEKEEAIRKIEWMAGQGIELIEQPMPENMIKETAWLKERSPLPIIADEAVNFAQDIPKLADAYNGINIKLMKSGGLVEAYKMCMVAEALGMDIMIGCMIESSAAINAAIQLQSLSKWLDLDGNLLIRNDPYSGAIFRDGQWWVSDLPGIGVVKRDAKRF